MLVRALQAQVPKSKRQQLWRIRKTEVTVEIWEKTVLRGAYRQTVGRCEQCRNDSLMVSPERVRQAVGVAVREVCRAVESEQVHYRETSHGELLVCLDSLRAWMHARRLPGPLRSPSAEKENEQ